MQCKLRKHQSLSLLQQNSGETEQTSNAGARCGECLVGGTKEWLVGRCSCRSATGSGASWRSIRRRTIEEDWDRGHWAACGWDLHGTGWDPNNAG